jgi:hypothetical protein
MRTRSRLLCYEKPAFHAHRSSGKYAPVGIAVFAFEEGVLYLAAWLNGNNNNNNNNNNNTIIIIST